MELGRVLSIHLNEHSERDAMTTPASGSLNTDFGLMTAVAGAIDTRNDELRAMLRAFIGQMTGVPASVWGGVAGLLIWGVGIAVLGAGITMNRDIT